MATENSTRFATVLLAFQTLLIVLFAVGTDYADSISGTNSITGLGEEMTKYYGVYQDVHVMIFVGFGFLMTFLAKYGFGAVGLNFLIGALSIQWGMLGAGFMHHMYTHSASHTIMLDIKMLIEGDFAAGAVLITFGALLGKTSPLQMVAIVFFELIFYNVNFFIGALKLQAVDMGGSMFVHTFGAYFGVAMAWAMGRGSAAGLKGHPSNESSKVSDTFAMIGTLFLWMFWPSFNGALAGATSQHRVVLNTVLSLTGSCIGSFIFSQMLRKGHKFSMVDIQNATLAGGVAVGSAADLVIKPWAAITVGFAASLVSVWGYTYLQPLLEEKIGLFDTCGVHNLHGMPGLIGGLSGTISAAMVGDNVYGQNIGEIYPARSTCSSATAEATCTANDHCAWSGTACTGDARTASEQASMQICALLITVAMAIGGGLFTAAIVKGDFFEPPPTKDCYSDHLYWDEVEAEDDDEETGGSVEMTAVVSGGTPSAGSTA